MRRCARYTLKNPDPSPAENRHRSAALVMASTTVSRLLGFVRIAVIGAIFGASGEADVLHVVFNIPNNLRKLLAEGALSSAFLPVLARSHHDDPSGTQSRQLVRQLFGFQLVLLVPLLIGATVFAEPIVHRILAFPEPERQILAVQLFRWLIHYVLLISLAAVLVGTLNSHHRFFVPAVAPLLFSVSVIGSVVLLHRELGVFSMVVGVLAGGAAQLVIQIPPVLRRGYSLIPVFRFHDPVFLTVLRQWFPVLATASIFAIDQQIALFFASGLSDGSGSALANALVFWQLPFGIFSASITTVLFPLMSQQWGQNDLTGLRASLLGGLRSLALLLIPSAGALIVLGAPMIAIALQRGAFSAENTALTARVLMGYSVGLFSVGAFTFVQRFFYALGDYRTPIIASAATVMIDVLLSLYLKETVLGVVGLSIANSTAFSVGLIILLLSARQKLPATGPRIVTPAILRALIATAAAAATVILIRSVFSSPLGNEPWWVEGSTFRALGRLLGEGISALVVLLGVYTVLGISPSALLRRNSEVTKKEDK